MGHLGPHHAGSCMRASENPSSTYPVSNDGRGPRLRYAVRGDGRERGGFRMRAAWYERAGPASEVLTVGEMDAPRPGPEEVVARPRLRGQPRGDQEALRLDGLRHRLPARRPPQRRRGHDRGGRGGRSFLPRRRAGVGVEGARAVTPLSLLVLLHRLADEGERILGAAPRERDARAAVPVVVDARDAVGYVLSLEPDLRATRPESRFVLQHF